MAGSPSGPEQPRSSHLALLKRLIPNRWREHSALGAVLFMVTHVAVPAVIALVAYVARWL
jgi:hypothetical protein